MSQELRINETDNKNEVVAAYQELLKKLQETKRVSLQEEEIIEEKDEIVEMVTHHTPDDLKDHFENLKQHFISSLDEIKEKFLSEQKKLILLTETIQEKSEQLAGIEELEIEAEAQMAFKNLQKQKMEALERELAEQQQALSMEMIQKKKELQQEELKAKHLFEVSRQKDINKHQMEMRDLDKELSIARISFQKECEERETHIKQAEFRLQQLEQLEEKVAKFPEELYQAEQRIVEQLTQKFNYEAQLFQKELKLREQTIATLEAKIALLESNLSHFESLKNSFNRLVSRGDSVASNA